jgi:hypothetical protein
MVTEISGAGVSHSVAAQTSAAAAARVAETSRPVNSGVVSDVVSRDKQSTTATQVTGAFAQLRTRQEVLNQAASTVRDVGNTAKEAEQLLGKMEEDLTAVVKMYPPYPLDNPERVSLLNSFGGLRRQIDALTFPPPEALAAVDEVLGSQETTTIATDVKPESLAATLDREPMWDIPVLDPESASDEEVSKALEHVASMQGFLEDLQSSMWEDVVSFVNQAATPEAESKGAEVRDLLAELGSERNGIGRNATQLEAAAESQ